MNFKSMLNNLSSQQLKWNAEDFGCINFNEELNENIAKFQKEHELIVSGIVDEMTFTRLQTYLEHQKFLENKVENPKEEYYVFRDGQKLFVGDLKIDHSMDLNKNSYEKNNNPTKIVVHWDATFNSKNCFNILQKRKLSTHFSIDNDGTIYQFVDLFDTAWHCGKYNTNSIGIDMSNAYYLKYQDWYQKNIGKPKPIISDSVIHGVKLGNHLGYYPEQLESFEKLVSFLTSNYGIELICPPDQKVNKEAQQKNYNGICCHYHLTEDKIDCAGIDLNKRITNIKTKL